MKARHAANLAEGFGAVFLPLALARKYPHATRKSAWPYVFVAARRSFDPRSGAIGRHHVEAQSIQRTVQDLLGHADVSTTMIYTHVLNRGGLGVRSPLDDQSSQLSLLT